MEAGIKSNAYVRMRCVQCRRKLMRPKQVKNPICHECRRLKLIQRASRDHSLVTAR